MSAEIFFMPVTTLLGACVEHDDALRLDRVDQPMCDEPSLGRDEPEAT